jgi:mRNA interferase RelE/StbE
VKYEVYVCVVPFAGVPHDVVEPVRGLHPHLKNKVKASLRLILDEPTASKPLRAELEGVRSRPVGRLRIIYRLSGDCWHIEIVAIGPCERIYEETFRLIRREQT